MKNRDRFRTMNNLIGDCYTVAIVQHLSKDELLKVSENFLSDINMDGIYIYNNTFIKCDVVYT